MDKIMKKILVIFGLILILSSCSKFQERGYLCKNINDETMTTSFLLKSNTGVLKTINLVQCGQVGNVKFFGETQKNCETSKFPVYVEFDEVGKTLRYEYDLSYSNVRTNLNYVCSETK
jgi:hypothetical protein